MTSRWVVLLLPFLATAANASDPCVIDRPSAGNGIELSQLPAILRQEIVSYYDSCESKNVIDPYSEGDKPNNLGQSAGTGSGRKKDFDTDVVNRSLQVMRNDLLESSAGVIAYRDSLTQVLSQIIDELSFPNQASPQSLLSLDSWKSSSQLVFGPLDFGNYLTTSGCTAEVIDDAEKYSQVCEPSVDAVVAALQFVDAIATVAKSAQMGEFRAYIGELDTLEKRWGSYFDDSRSLYIWELAANRKFHNGSRKNGDEFWPVPDRQYFFFHPSIAFEYVDDSSDGNQLEETLVLEIAGFNRWSWKESGPAKTSIAWGASIVAAYSDRASVDDLGWGVMFHIDHKYSFGVTKHGSSTGYFISMDIQKAIMGISDEDKSLFNGFNDLLKARLSN